MEGSSASGPDGFSASFYQHHWSIVINSFLFTRKLVKKINHNFIALIPKKRAFTELMIFDLLLYATSCIRLYLNSSPIA
ncbi:hypothetical protein EJ110_NYTH45595 [Nymphaea thermarum]|nr:hypothetical protein EJ110_NYTH45595 [Nymphaea thermarum]